MMRKFSILMLLVFSGLIISACGNISRGSGKPVVMTTLFPQYDFVRQIAGEYVELHYLLSPGQSAHSYEPTAATVVRILSSDLLIYTGDNMEPWVNTVIRSYAGSGLNILDLSKHVSMDLVDDHDDHDDDDDDDDHGTDPHIWQDPLLAKQMVEAIKEALISIVPEHEESIRINAAAYQLTLDALHHDFLDLVEHSELNIIMHGGHNAFGYFQRRYGLEYVTPYAGFSTDAEPLPQALAAMINLMNENNIEHLFSERLISPNVANAISQETGATILYIYAGENVPLVDFNAGITYIDLMLHNLEQFRIGLRYDATK